MGKVKPKKNWSHRYWQDNEECIQDNQPAIDVSDHRHVPIQALYHVREIGFTTSKDVENGSTASSEFISQQVPLKPYSAYSPFLVSALALVPLYHKFDFYHRKDGNHLQSSYLLLN